MVMRKRNIFLWLFLAVMCVIAVSCERDRVYQPKKKISKIYYDYVTGKDLLDTGHVTFEYEGDNVVKCTSTYGQYFETFDFAYSHVKNPFYNLLNQSSEWPFPYVISNQYMLNSLTSLSTLSGEGETSTVAGAADFDYDVEDEYPTRMTYHSHYWQVSPSYPDTSHTTYTYYFEYKN